MVVRECFGKELTSYLLFCVALLGCETVIEAPQINPLGDNPTADTILPVDITEDDGNDRNQGDEDDQRPGSMSMNRDPQPFPNELPAIRINNERNNACAASYFSSADLSGRVSYMIGVNQADAHPWFGTEEPGDVTIHIEEQRGPMTLVLNGYRRTRWHLAGPGVMQIERLVSVGYDEQFIEAPALAPNLIERFTVSHGDTMDLHPLPLLSWFNPNAGHCKDHHTLLNDNDQLSPEDLTALVSQNDHNCQHENLTVLLHLLSIDQIDAFAGMHQANSFTILKTTATDHSNGEEADQNHPPANEPEQPDEDNPHETEESEEDDTDETEQPDEDNTVSTTCTGQDENEKLARACEWLTHCMFGTNMCSNLRAVVNQPTEVLELMCVAEGDDITIALYCSQLECEDVISLFLQSDPELEQYCGL